MLTSAFHRDDRLKNSRRLDFLPILHRISCIYGVLITIFCLFRCYLSVTNALQDVHKFEHTGTFSYFLHFLGEYDFLESVFTFQLVTVELLLYVVQCRRVNQKKSSRGSIWYFVVMLVLHAIIWMHANSLPLPDFGPSNVAEEAGMKYRFFANVTVSPPVGYFFSYLWRMHKIQSAGSE